MRTLDDIDYPKTKNEWWLLVDYWRVDLLDLVVKYHPYYRRVHAHEITAPMAEKACEVVRREIEEKDGRDPQDRFVECVDNRDSDLASLLNEVWFGMPESCEVRTEKAFGVLCDLCSESCVLEEEEDAPDQP